MSKDKKKKHKKKHKKKDAVSTTGWVYEFTYTLPLTSFGSVSTGYGTIWSAYVPRVQVPDAFQQAFNEGELEP